MTRRDDSDQMPPDPWAEDGIDQLMLEKAEDLTHRDVDPASRAWDDIDGPTIEEFDDAAEELRSGDSGEGGGGALGLMRAWVGVVAFVVLLAFVLTYALR